MRSNGYHPSALKGQIMSILGEYGRPVSSYEVRQKLDREYHINVVGNALNLLIQRGLIKQNGYIPSTRHSIMVPAYELAGK